MTRLGGMIGMLLLAGGVLVSCSGDDASGPPLGQNDDTGADDTPADDATGDDGSTDDGSGDDGDDTGATVEGAFVFAADFRSGELWGFNPDTGSTGLLNTVSSEIQRLWPTADGLWLATPSEVLHVGTSGEPLGAVALEGVSDLAAGAGEVWVAGRSDASGAYLSKLDAETHEEVASLAVQELAGEFGQFEDIARGDDAVWLAYTLASNRATEIDRMDPASLEVVGTTTVPIEALTLVWHGSSLWAAGWSAESSDFGVVQIGADGSVISESEITDFEKSEGWGLAVTDDGVWVANFTTSELIHLDPASGGELARNQFADLGDLRGIHASDGRLWASVHQGDSAYIELTLHVIDPATYEATPVMELPERLQATFLPDGS